ncbi:helicase-related protein [Fundidesulfovibrio soli]|uniref:helicase-related protein n=1 Tax=Fundidesulfovibrio soli TaxID=2922716 RepID=UPI001FAFBD6F|nr:helicase-related protein [Fundidesulfovibrio soli]
MNHHFRGWGEVGDRLRQKAAREAAQDSPWLNQGQRDSLLASAERLENNGIILADEVGMGKTRIAVAVINAVAESGGRVAVLIPPGLGSQWDQELRTGGRQVHPVLRNLWSYFEAWAPEASPSPPPWFDRDVVLVSHLFSNWRLEENSTWRWALLQTLYYFWRRRRGGRFPKWHKSEAPLHKRVDAAAQSIVDMVPEDKSHVSFRLLEEMFTTIPEIRTPPDGALYARHKPLREPLERAVGLGLGVFDLVVIDEAHKSRGDDSGLTRLTETMILHAPEARRLALTATPVEMDVSQWMHSLQRIGVDQGRRDAIRPAVQNFAQATRDVRKHWQYSALHRERFAAASRTYREALSPYLLRRDKREDDAVELFADTTRGPYDAYRALSEISIDVVGLPAGWKRAVCAAESLSAAVSLAEDSGQKRLRLTFGNGHGLSSIIDTASRCEVLDKQQIDHEGAHEGVAHLEEPAGEAHRMKRRQRASWWMDIMRSALAEGERVLFRHPAILAAVEEIEKHTRQGEKVLVFGRYTRPMQALVHLLNAREMIRCISGGEGRYWPQSKVRKSLTAEDDELQAVRAALAQLRPGWDIPDVDQALKLQFHGRTRQLKAFRKDLVAKLEDGFSRAVPGSHDRAKTMCEDFIRSVREAAAKEGVRGLFPLVSRALFELIGPEKALSASPQDLAGAFCTFIDVVTDKDEGDLNGDNSLDAEEARSLWSAVLKKMLGAEFRKSQGRFACLMYGQTDWATRRVIQAGFNSPDSSPRVLIAQSVVGREGLNLHQACRVVVLLHPEWNPGVVEQQIGRVDRVGSMWSALLKQAVVSGVQPGELPRILVKPVIFKGTYDEHNWNVLQERWQDLRAQLHGVVIPHEHAAGDREAMAIVDELAQAAPSFSPSGKRTQGRADPGA